MKSVASGLFFLFVFLFCCSSDEPGKGPTNNPPPVEEIEFEFGADLSYVNQVVDKGGVYKNEDAVVNPYKIFGDHGATLARFRLWHNPTWTKEVYGANGSQFYNDLDDVKRSIIAAKAEGMKILLDFHFSDTWADPGKQHIPAAWSSIKSLDVLEDSVYNYVFKTFQNLNADGLLPEYVQLGNEINCGVLFSNAPQGFPALNVCSGQWSNVGTILNSAIKAVRDATANSAVKTKVILHVADPKNVDWWFTSMRDKGKVTDFEIIGFSYYPLWHTTVDVEAISNTVSSFKTKFSKDVMIMETAYPWTTEADDSYNNQFGNSDPLPNFPFTEDGQYEFMKKLVTEVKEGKGMGVIYWEPAWISSDMKDLWGTGSSWENNTFFRYDGNVHKGIDYMKFTY